MMCSSLFGCGKKETKEQDTAMGHYMEEEMLLPDDIQSIYDIELMEDDSLWMAAFTDDYYIFSSEDKGKSWKKLYSLEEDTVLSGYITDKPLDVYDSSAHPQQYLLHYYYDPDIPSMPEEELKIKEENLSVLRKMAATDAGKNMMHEGFHCDNPAQYTREWFSWANAMYAELVLGYLGYEIKK